jgi:thymidylate kinase
MDAAATDALRRRPDGAPCRAPPGGIAASMYNRRAAPLSAPMDSSLAAPNSGAQNLVVEFLGVSGSGKSTLARSLAARFEQEGYRARLLTMQRPTLSKRLIGVVDKSGNMLKVALSNRCQFGAVWFLLRLFPQKNLLHAARVMQYLMYLFAIRSNMTGNSQIAIFDQGFIQALYSLMLFGKGDGRSEFLAALNAILEPDILITLDVSVETVDRRLRERRRLAQVARVVANDHETIRRSLNLIKTIENTLRERQCRVVNYCPDHPVSIEQSTDELFRAVWPIVSEAARARAMAQLITTKEDAGHGRAGMTTLLHRATASPTMSPSRRHGKCQGGAAVQPPWRRLPL